MSMIARARGHLFPYVMATPIAVLLGMFVGVPMIIGIWDSMFQTTIGSTAREWIGLDNYRRLLSDAAAGHALLVTLAYATSVVVLAVGVALAAALALNRPFRFRSVGRSVMTIPWALPEVAAVLVFLWIFNPSFGVANLVASGLPMVTENPTWFLDPALAFPLVAGITAWKLFPFFALVILAALQTVPESLYEAARVDGATTYRAFRHITLPWLSPVLALCAILASIYAFKHFTLIWLLTGGGPGVTTETLVIRTYSTAFRFFDVSYADTLGAAGLLMVVFVTAMFLYVQRRFGSEVSE